MTDYRKARATACPRCAAEPGNPCVNAYRTRMPLLHPCRWRAAAGENGNTLMTQRPVTRKRLGKQGGPLPSIDVADALVDQRRANRHDSRCE